MVVDVLVAAVVVAAIVWQAVWWPKAVRRGREARAANGGRHTKWWWLSLAIGVAAFSFLIVTAH